MTDPKKSILFSIDSFAKRFFLWNKLRGFVGALALFQTILLFLLVLPRAFFPPSEGDEMALITWARQGYYDQELYNFPSSLFTGLYFSLFDWNLIHVRLSVFTLVIISLLASIYQIVIAFRLSPFELDTRFILLLLITMSTPLLTLGSTTLIPSYHILAIVFSWFTTGSLLAFFLVSNNCLKIIFLGILSFTTSCTIVLRPSQYAFLMILTFVSIFTQSNNRKSILSTTLFYFSFLLLTTILLVRTSNEFNNILRFVLDHSLFSTMPFHTLFGNVIFNFLVVTVPIILNAFLNNQTVRRLTIFGVVFFETLYLTYYLRLSLATLLSFFLIVSTSIFAYNLKCSKRVIVVSSLVTSTFSSYIIGSYTPIRDSLPSQISILGLNIVLLHLLGAQSQISRIRIDFFLLTFPICFAYCLFFIPGSPSQQALQWNFKTTINGIVPFQSSPLERPRVVFFDLSGFYNNWSIPYFNNWVAPPHIFSLFFLETVWGRSEMNQDRVPRSRIDRFDKIIEEYSLGRQIQILVSLRTSKVQINNIRESGYFPVQNLSTYSRNLVLLLFPNTQLCIADLKPIKDSWEVNPHESFLFLLKPCT